MHDNGSYAVRAGIVSPNYFDTLKRTNRQGAPLHR